MSVDDNELERGRVSYSRDAYGRIIEISNEIGEISYTYDEYSRVKSVTDENNTTLSYTYDSYGRKSSVKATTEDGKEYGTTYYEYDKYNRLIKISNSYENYTEYSYNTDGTLAREQSSNGIITLYTYNICGEINSLKTIDANSNIVAEYIYARNAAGDITKIEEKTLRADGTLKEKTTQYEYDKSARLTKEIISNADGSIIFEYTYDSLSNRTSQTVAFTGNITDLLDETGRETVEEGNIAYSYNVCNQLVKEEITYLDNTSKTTIYTYNADGDLLSKESGSENTIYKYNVYGYMSTATKTKSSTDEISGDEKLTQTIEKYGYDSEGVRIWKETDGNRTAYVTDKSLTYSQVRDVCGTIGSEI